MGEIFCIPFPNPYVGNQQVGPGEIKEVWRLDVNGGYAGFVEQVSCDWFANTYIEFIIDGVLIEKIQRDIPINRPEPYNPPLVAVKSIRFVVHNESLLDHAFGILTKGRLCTVKK